MIRRLLHERILDPLRLDPEETEVRGPIEETQYILDRDRAGRSQYHPVARDATRTALEVSPRKATEIVVLGHPENLRLIDESALETLLNESELTTVGQTRTLLLPGLKIDNKRLAGRVEASSKLTDAVFSLYSGHLLGAYFLDENQQAITALFDTPMQVFWLPDSIYPVFEEKLDERTADAMTRLEQA